MTDSKPSVVMNGGTTVWCEDGHAPMLIKERHSDNDNQACPECGNEFRVSVTIEQVNDE